MCRPDIAIFNGDGADGIPLRPASRPWRERFAALLERIRAHVVSTVAQVDFLLLHEQFGPPRRWKPPRPSQQPAPVLTTGLIAY